MTRTRKRLTGIAAAVFLASFGAGACRRGAAQEPVFYTGHGGQQTVSGSLHALEVAEQFYLVDTGAFVGQEGLNHPWPEELPPDRIAAVFITHAHADHVGRLPLLLHEGYQGPIYMTPATLELARVTLAENLAFADFGIERFHYSRHNRDRARIPVWMEGYDFGRFNVAPRNRVYIEARRGELAARGFFLAPAQRERLEEELLARLRRQAVTVEPGREVPAGPFTVRFVHTSHIPGSVMIRFRMGSFRILFTGDMGGNRHPLLRPNQVFGEPLDVLFTEGTYSSDRAGSPEEARREFRRMLGSLIEQGYRVVVPAFVLDRTQMVLHEISTAIAEGTLPRETPVTVYSRQARRLLEVYESMVQDGTMGESFALPPGGVAFRPPGWREPPPAGRLNLSHGEIGIMASGMAEHSYARQAVREFAGDARTAFLFVGYQAPGTPGHALTSGVEQLRLDGSSLTVRARVETSSAFGGHADPAEVIRVFGRAAPRQVFLVHLDTSTAPKLEARYREAFSAEVTAPRPGERILLRPR